MMMRMSTRRTVSWAACFILLQSARAFLSSSTTSRAAVVVQPLDLALSERELEIRRKIKQLKKDGRINKKDDDDDEELEDYTDKIRQKLGSAKSKMLGYGGTDDEGASSSDDDDDDDDSPMSSKPRLGALPATAGDDDEQRYQPIMQSDEISFAQELGNDDDDDDGDDVRELSEEDLVDLVARRMQEKRDRERREDEEQRKNEASERIATREKSTSGVGGSWGENQQAKTDMYQPKTGSWGAFPRPRDISKAYGGGRRVGPGYSNEEESRLRDEETRERLQRYREKVGIDVQSEKEHAAEIEEALNIATIAMQRGVYSTAVSALEKVTQYCSTNSKVGGKVFLELAMAYEAIGRTKEAITVYSTLTRSRIEEIKVNAKRLLYAIEAMRFMQENVSSSEFSRKRARTTFIDTTDFVNIASKFDDVYETAYVDLERGFYKKLTESVVRSSREARQVLLLATGPGEVGRMRIVQALRSLSRHFAESLQKEIEASIVRTPVAVIDGKPIVKESTDDIVSRSGIEEYVLMDPEQMLDNLNGEWRLQLIADKRGDGVKFFNSTVAWQQVDKDSMTFRSLSPQGFLTIEQSGKVKFNAKKRILRRRKVEVTGGGGVFASLFGKSGAVGAVRAERQVILVDSTMLVTRGVPSTRGPNDDDEKDYFAVWRRVEPGTQ